MTTRAGEGEKFVNYSLGGKGACDEIVSFPKNASDAKGNKTLVSAHSGYAVELVGVVDGTEKNLMAKESALRGNLEQMRADRETLIKAREYFQGIVEGAAENDAVETPAVTDAKAKLAKIEALEKTNDEGLKNSERALDGVTTDLLDKHREAYTIREANMMREKETREAIAFVDGAGLAVLGVDNVQGFFDAVSEKYGLAENDKINPAERAMDAHQKRLILQVFARLVGSSDGETGMFDPTTHALRDGKTEGEVRA